MWEVQTMSDDYAIYLVEKALEEGEDLQELVWLYPWLSEFIENDY